MWRVRAWKKLRNIWNCRVQSTRAPPGCGGRRRRYTETRLSSVWSAAVGRAVELLIFSILRRRACANCERVLRCFCARACAVRVGGCTERVCVRPSETVRRCRVTGQRDASPVRRAAAQLDVRAPMSFLSTVPRSPPIVFLIIIIIINIILS